MLRLFVSCAKGMEQLLENELQGLGAKSISVTQAGCYVDAEFHEESIFDVFRVR